MNKKFKVFFSILILSVFLLLLIGSGESNSPTNSTQSNNTTQNETKKEQVKQFYNVGETAKFNGAEMTVTKVEKSNGSEYDKPKDGMEFVIVTVKIKNAGKDKLSYNPLYFKMQNSKGQITDETFSTINQNTALQSGDLAIGGEVEGSIIFEEPINDPGLVLQYQDNIFNKEAKLQFKLQ
ncbi:DUF4352 domain-containing protein [Aceticella autotrophica]|uniref:DUF4352 domain-containing protein n=1 Tax=Aceticella autotrophica TaxID=2755338 RepID=A0A975AW31_9THEO|nr:DUF4352 domain-containing protein [Aceticella autotrophica]QSZ27545.1 DUF4352 domain-containing protein [Aceticella autotrophica]